MESERMNGISNMYGNTIGMMEKSLDFLWTKQGVTSNNIANVDTPGYKSKYVPFEETFQRRLAAASGTRDGRQMKQAIAGASTVIHETTGETARLDENNVNADSEMVELTRTALQYQYGLNSVNSDITRLRTAIKGQ